jgi:hypothetical protein
MPDRRIDPAARFTARQQLGRPAALLGCNGEFARGVARNCLANRESLKLRMVEIERLVLACPMMRGSERFGPSPRPKRSTTFPNRVGRSSAAGPLSK